jgi:hypothetical protein
MDHKLTIKLQKVKHTARQKNDQHHRGDDFYK